MVRKVKVELEAGNAQFKQAMSESERAAKKLDDALDGINGKSVDNAAISVKGLGAASKAAAAQAKQNFDEISRHTKRLDGQIRETETSIKSLTKEFAKTGDSGVLKSLKAQQSQLRELTQVRNLLPSPEEFAKAGRGIGGDIIAGIRSSMGGVNPESLGVPLLAGLFAPTLGAAVSGAVVGAAGVGGVIGGVMLASRNDQVKSAGKNLGQTLLADLQTRAGGFVDPVLNGIDRIRSGFREMGPDLDRIFGSSSKFVAPLTDGLVKAGQGFVSGFADAVENADPVINALHNTIVTVGTSTGELFSGMAEDAQEGASAIDDLTMSITSMITATGAIVHASAEVKGFTDELDTALDKARYWIEDNAKAEKGFHGLADQLDLTADGFAVGSAEAEAYRKATLGTAEAADFAVLKQAGMDDVHIAAADASGKYRAQLDQVSASTAQAVDATGRLIATEEDLKQVQEAASTAQQSLTSGLSTMGPTAGLAAQQVDALKKATLELYGAQIQAMDANEGFEASWDNLSASVKKNKDTLDIHTGAGRSNRDALQDLLTKSNELYFADINSGVAIDEARKKHEKRTDRIRKEAGQLSLNRAETNKLIGTYGKIPPRKETDLVLSGVNAVADALLDLATVQLHLAKGTPLSPTLSKRLARAQYGMPDTKRATGGILPGSAPHDRADNMIYAGTPGEWVIQRPTVRAVEARHGAGAMDHFNRTGELPGYATGGRLAAASKMTIPADMRYEVTATGTKIPSLKDVVDAVKIVAGGNWPSSPGAQRGDSGVWRQVVALIRSTGPMSGKFGNGYRPGDPKWHGSGRAVDWMGYEQDGLASFLAARRPLELIHRTKHRDYAYTRGQNKGSFNEALMNAHRNHVHIAMAGGGTINEHVLGVGRSGATYEFGERGPETVVPGYASGGLVNFAPGATSSTATKFTPTGTHLDYLAALIGAKDSVAQLNASLKENGRSFSLSTQKGRENRQALIGGIRGAQAAAEAKYAETGSVKAANKVYDDHIRQLDAVLKRQGLNAKARRDLLKVFGERPKYDLPTAAVRAPTNSSNLISATQDHIAIEESLQTLRGAFAWTKPSFNLKTDQGRAELQTLFGYLGAASQGAQSMFDYMGDPKQAMAYYNGYINQLRQTLIKSGMKPAEVDALIKRYGRITLQPKSNRWGGVYEHAANGKLTDAQIRPGGPTQYAWAEPSTGGELFAPKNGNLAKTRAEVGWAVQNWWGGQVNWQRGGAAGQGSPARTVVVDATIPITLGGDTISRQVHLVVDTVLGRLVDATVYQAA